MSIRFNIVLDLGQYILAAKKVDRFISKPFSKTKHLILDIPISHSTLIFNVMYQGCYLCTPLTKYNIPAIFKL